MYERLHESRILPIPYHGQGITSTGNTAHFAVLSEALMKWHLYSSYEPAGEPRGTESKQEEALRTFSLTVKWVRSDSV